jgi:hypothetical protein
MEAASRRPLGVTAFFTLLSQRFVEGRLGEMAASWTFPCPIEINGQLVVMRSPEVLEAHLAKRRAASLAAGLVGMRPRISAIEMPRNGRFRVWLRWVLDFGDHVEEEDHGTVYFMTVSPGGRLTIEMMDVVQLPLAKVTARIA